MVGYRIPDADTEPAELQAPRIPTPDERPTVDLPRSPATISEPVVFATWEQSKELVVGPPPVDDSPALRRKIRWISIALAASLSAQLGGLLGDRLLPMIVDRVRFEEVTYQRVWKSARSIETSHRLGLAVSADVQQLQREAEEAAFAGDAALAKRKLEELDARWPRRE